jgi:hypothetical protein
MADDGEKPAKSGEHRIAGIFEGEKCGEEALEDVDHRYGQGGSPTLDPEDVRRSHTPAPELTDVIARGQPDKDVAGGDRPDKIGGDGDNNPHVSS